MAIYVLVPGGFSGSWQWKRDVTKALWVAGHEVHTPSLTGMGERVHLAHPDINLSTHIQDVVNEITFSDLHEVILVGYSYSGMVITGVADKIPERIAQLVYVDAWVSEDGQAATDLLGPQATSLAMQAVQAYGEGWKLYPNEPDDERLTPQPIKTGLEKLSLRNPAASRLSRVFIYCTLEKNGEDLMLVPMTRTAEKVRNDPHWKYFEIESNHSVVKEHPDKIVDILLELAKVAV